jgi:hypothetical protein
VGKALRRVARRQGCHERGRQLRWPLSYDREREGCSQNDQCIYTSDHDAEINVGHDLLRLELGLPTEHRLLRAIVTQKMGSRSDKMSKSIPMYRVPKPFDWAEVEKRVRSKRTSRGRRVRRGGCARRHRFARTRLRDHHVDLSGTKGTLEMRDDLSE